jgi:ABC-type glycerol-3-phosphate transport system substrate-binding protein
MLERTARDPLSRRRVLCGGLAAATALNTAILRRPARAQTSVTLTMAVWGAQAEQDAFNAVIRKYQAQRPNVTIRMEVNGNSGQLYQQVDTRLAGHQAPDLFRIQYQQFGRYAAAWALVDIGPYLNGDGTADFAPAFWQATNYQGKTFALPHHTDTFACYYNVGFLKQLGVEPPASLEKSWSWSDFVRIGRAIKDKGLAPYGFAMAWQVAAGYRWLPFLYQHGGQLLDADLGSRRSIRARASKRSPGRSPGSRKDWCHPAPISRARSRRRTCSQMAQLDCCSAVTGRFPS